MLPLRAWPLRAWQERPRRQRWRCAAFWIQAVEPPGRARPTGAARPRAYRRRRRAQLLAAPALAGQGSAWRLPWLTPCSLRPEEPPVGSGLRGRQEIPGGVAMPNRSEKLNALVIGFECRTSWDEMKGDGPRRFCAE